MLVLLPRVIVVLTLVFSLAAGLPSLMPLPTQARWLEEPPSGCTMPCWLGIQPGVTSAQTAIDLLSSHPWVARVLPFEMPYTIVQWEWSGQQPGYIDTHDGSSLQIRDERVQYIDIATTIPYGEIALLYGRPELGGTVVTDFAEGLVMARYLAYPEAGLQVQSYILCPLTIHNYWQSASYIRMGDTLRLNLPRTDVAGWMHDAFC